MNAPAPGFLRRLNPLSKVAAVVPAWVALLFVHDVGTPALLAAAALVLLLLGGGLSRRAVAAVLVGVPAATAVMAVGFAFWANTGPGLTGASLLVGLTTASRIAALGTLAMLGGLTTGGPEFARALTAQLRVPYRFAYTAVAAYRFVPRSTAELGRIRSAQRVRGVAPGRGPVEALRRAVAPVVPLLASGIRHADRVALAMESRAFGAHATRTERHPPLWRTRDTVFVVVAWAATAAALVLG
ncbi:energy-coupling factor transporter transmembrane protein EcfT [Leifsonia sp. ku-ls]|nr:energy-coupling factor transporter transmembrane protein EcfT [Leifsonia sp. ku-ls]